MQGNVPTTTTSYWSAKVAAVLEKARHADREDAAVLRKEPTANLVANMVCWCCSNRKKYEDSWLLARER